MGDDEPDREGEEEEERRWVGFLLLREKEAVVDSLVQLRARLERFAARPLRDLERRVDELSARLRREMRGELGRAGHRLALATRALRASDPVARVAGDRHRLRQLLLNLTDNAAKYNHPKGTVTLALRRRHRLWRAKPPCL